MENKKLTIITPNVLFYIIRVIQRKFSITWIHTTCVYKIITLYELNRNLCICLVILETGINEVTCFCRERLYLVSIVILLLFNKSTPFLQFVTKNSKILKIRKLWSRFEVDTRSSKSRDYCYIALTNIYSPSPVLRWFIKILKF